MCLLFPFAPAFPVLEKNEPESGTGLAVKKEGEAEGLSNLIGATSPDTSDETVLSIVHAPPHNPPPRPALPLHTLLQSLLVSKNREARGLCSLESCLHCICSLAARRRDFMSLCKECNKKPQLVASCGDPGISFPEAWSGSLGLLEQRQRAAGKSIWLILTSFQIASSTAHWPPKVVLTGFGAAPGRGGQRTSVGLVVLGPRLLGHSLC